MTTGKDWADERAEKWFELDCPRETYLGSSMVGGRELKKAVASLLRIVARDQRYASIEALHDTTGNIVEVALMGKGLGVAQLARIGDLIEQAVMNASPKRESK